jgi:hypothetical protein
VVDPIPFTVAALAWDAADDDALPARVDVSPGTFDAGACVPMATGAFP